MTLVSHDGRPVADDPAAASRAFHYGDGIFRTMLLYGGRVVGWDRHARKLHRDCAALGMDAPDLGQLEQDLAEAIRRVSVLEGGTGVLKFVIARRPRHRGYAPQGASTERWLFADPLPDIPVNHYRRGIPVTISQVGCAEQPLLAGIKHLNRLEQVLASRDWPEGVCEALMCDARGNVVCGTRSNLFCVRSGRLLTPLLDRCGVAGTMREHIMDRAGALDTPVEEVRLTIRELNDADEVFVCNAVFGIWPVAALGATIWDAPGPFTRQLIDAVAHPLIAVR